MLDITVTDVRILPGDSGFLLDDGKTSILFDTSFAFTGYRMAEKVKELLGERKLDYIFLSHSHYDHVVGAPYVLKYYPEATVVAGEYAAKIFAKPTARAIMRDLDRKYAETCGVTEYEDLIDELKVDITVNDGDSITCGDMTFTVVSLPGHTKDSIAFYLQEKKLLLGSETLGVYFGNDTYLPFFLVGYQMSLDAFAKVKAMDIDYMLLPHYGVVDKAETQRFLTNAEWVFRDTAEKIVELYKAGGTVEDGMEYYKERFYKDNVKPTYPVNAFRLNTSIMVELIRKEFLMDSNVGEELKKAGRELKAQFLQEDETTGSTQTTSGESSTSTINATTATVSRPANAETTAVLETADAECALTVPTEDGERGEFTCLNEKTYSYLLPKDPGFVDEGDCGAAEIHQAYGCGREINYERDAVICFSIAGEFDCEIKESRAKAAYTRYDSAPTRSKLMTIEHPLFTHAYLFETPKKYRITYLKQLEEYELLGCELILRKSGGDDAWKAKMIEEFKRFAGSCREV